MSTEADLEADLQEVKAMLMLSKRPTVRQELERIQAKLEGELAKAKGGAPVETPATPAPPAEQAAAPAEKAAPVAKATLAPEAPHKPVPVVVKSAGPWTEITTFSLDLGGYDKPHVTVDIRLKGIEALPSENVICDFTQSSFDLKVVGLDGQNYRFLKTNLDKDVVPADCSVKVKKNHVIVSLQKVKGEYGFDSWTDLCAKGKRKPAASKNKDPQESIMGMMTDLYDDGDDNMKKIIGEAMYKARRGEKYDPKNEMEDMKMPDLDSDI